MRERRETKKELREVNLPFKWRERFIIPQFFWMFDRELIPGSLPVVIHHIKDDIFTPPPVPPEPLKECKPSLSVATLSMSPPIATIPLRRPSLQLPYSPSLSSLPRSSPGLDFHPPAPTAEEEEYDDENETVEETVHERIERELNEGEAEARTGVCFLLAKQGMRLSPFSRLLFKILHR